MKPHNRDKSKGLATVELAICLPLLVLIILGSIQACNMIFLKQAVTEAAYEGAMVAARPKSEQSVVTSRIQSILAARGITSTSITVANNDLDNVDPGDLFTIQVSAAPSTNRLVSPTATYSSDITTTVTARKQ